MDIYSSIYLHVRSEWIFTEIWADIDVICTFKNIILNVCGRFHTFFTCCTWNTISVRAMGVHFLRACLLLQVAVHMITIKILPAVISLLLVQCFVRYSAFRSFLFVKSSIPGVLGHWSSNVSRDESKSDRWFIRKMLALQREKATAPDLKSSKIGVE